MLKLKTSLTLLVLLPFLTGAHAAITQQTSYSFFKVQGHSPREIYNSLMKHAKGPQGHDAYATTAIKVFQQVSFKGSPQCRVSKIMLSGSFNINLPKLATAPANAATLQNWQIFIAALRAHEEHHRELWLACIAQLDASAKSMAAKSCNSLNIQLKKNWAQIQSNCFAQNTVFDKQEQKNILKQPFIKMVVRGY
jgi:predicted secreted Zn-dependent protease